MFSYQLSSFNGSSGTIDIFLDTQNQTINGFQLIFSINNPQQFQVTDKDVSLSGNQLDISANSDFVFLSNQATPGQDSTQIIIAAISSNPTKPVQFRGRQIIARLSFNQSQPGQIIISQDDQKTKVALSEQETSQKFVTQPTTISINSSSISDQSPAPLAGQMYDQTSHSAQLNTTQPENIPTAKPTTFSSSKPIATITPALPPTSRTTLFIVALCFIFILLTISAFFLGKKSNKNNLPPSPPPLQ